MRIGVKSAADFVALLLRRKWWVIVPFVALSCIVAVLTKELPRIYVSEALVLVRPRDVPQVFVMDLISGSLQQRLRSIEQTVRSRQNIVAILSEFRSKLPEFDRLNTDEAVDRLRRQIDIRFDIVSESSGTTVSSFRLLFSHKDPEVAKEINKKLTTLFIDQDSRARESNVFGTTGFMSTELEKARVDLEQSDEKLKILKGKFRPELPQQMEANLQALNRLNDQKRYNVEIMERLRTQRQSIEERMTQEDEFLKVEATPRKSSNPKIEEFRQAKERLEATIAKFPANSPMPDIPMARTQMERAEAKLTPEEREEALKAPTTPTGEDGKPLPNPVYQNLKNQLKQIDQEIRFQEKNRNDIDSDYKIYSARVERTPQVEQELTDVIRENMDLKKEYDGLKEKLTAARLSESLESKQRAGQFQVLDEANAPIESAKPNKWAVLLTGVVFSLGLSIGIAVLVDVLRQRVWTQSEIEAFWGVPVMVDIPQILTDADIVVAHRKKWIMAASSLAGAVVFSLCLYLIYLRTPYILEQLDPVLQKVVYR